MCVYLGILTGFVTGCFAKPLLAPFILELTVYKGNSVLLIMTPISGYVYVLAALLAGLYTQNLSVNTMVIHTHTAVGCGMLFHYNQVLFLSGFLDTSWQCPGFSVSVGLILLKFQKRSRLT